jgi:hypothetical protein
MKFRVEVVCISDTGQEHRSDALEMERRQLAMETLGLNLCESKAMLESVQDFMVAQQAAEDLEQRRCCSSCGDRYTAKGGGKIAAKTWFGVVKVANPPLESLLVSAERPPDIPARGGLAAWHDQSGVVVPGDQVGIADSLYQSRRLCCARCCRQSLMTRPFAVTFRQLPKEWSKS